MDESSQENVEAVPSDSESERIAELFERTARVFFRAKSPLQPQPDGKSMAFDLTMAQARCLRALSRCDNCTLRDLSQNLGVSPSTASELVDRLVRSELAVREDDPDDRRAVRLKLTEQGQELLRQHRAHKKAHLRQFLGRLTTQQRSQMLQALETLNQVIEEVTLENK